MKHQRILIGFVAMLVAASVGFCGGPSFASSGSSAPTNGASLINIPLNALQTTPVTNATSVTLFSYTVTATPVTVIHYANPPSGYRALELSYSVGSTTNAAVDSIGVTLNLDSGANYDRMDLSATAGGAGTYNTTSATSMGNIEISGGTRTNDLTYCTLTVFDYDNVARWKVSTINSASFPSYSNGSWSRNLGMYRWRNLAAVTNITWSVGAGPSFQVGSKFVVKGIQ